MKKKITPPIEETIVDPEAVPQFVPKEEVETAPIEATETVPAEEVAAPVKKAAVNKARRSRKYVAARARVDKTKNYSLPEAVKLVKELSYSKFKGSIEAHLVVKEAGIAATFTFPHTTGKTVRVAIMNDDVIANLNKEVIDFDILIAKPEDMKKLAKYARLLGPKGLMPNPKNGTITPNPEAQKKALEGGSVTIKSERKAPLVHAVIGKVSNTDQEIQENIEALLKAFSGKVLKMHLTASMSPSVKVVV